jgi:hypothetical protein
MFFCSVFDDEDLKAAAAAEGELAKKLQVPSVHPPVAAAGDLHYRPKLQPRSRPSTGD